MQTQRYNAFHFSRKTVLCLILQGPSIVELLRFIESMDSPERKLGLYQLKNSRNIEQSFTANSQNIFTADVEIFFVQIRENAWTEVARICIHSHRAVNRSDQHKVDLQNSIFARSSHHQMLKIASAAATKKWSILKWKLGFGTMDS